MSDFVDKLLDLIKRGRDWVENRPWALRLWVLFVLLPVALLVVSLAALGSIIERLARFTNGCGDELQELLESRLFSRMWKAVKTGKLEDQPS